MRLSLLRRLSGAIIEPVRAAANRQGRKPLLFKEKYIEPRRMAGWQLNRGLKYKWCFYKFRLLYICHASASTPPKVGVIFVFR